MQDKQFDLTRNDKFYELTIPRYNKEKELVLYEIHLKNLVKNETYISDFRFKELKEYHENLQKLNLELPPFPKTHLWKKTNKNPEMIRQRQAILEKYLNIIVNDPFTRGYPDVKKFIKLCKFGQRNFRSQSFTKSRRTPSQTAKSKSLSKARSDFAVDFLPTQ